MDEISINNDRVAIFFFKLSRRKITMINAPHNISVTPRYRVRHDKATDDEKSISEVTSFFSRFESANMKLRSTNNMKRGSDQAITETEKSGIENKIANAPTRAKAGKDDRCLKVSKPPTYTINPKTSAFRIFAIKRGSVLKIPPTSARTAGYSGGHTTVGKLPSYLTNPAPAMRFRAILM